MAIGPVSRTVAQLTPEEHRALARHLAVGVAEIVRQVLAREAAAKATKTARRRPEAAA
jgi:hypothetical protein